MPKQGVQYVSGTPPQTPVLRPLRQPLYDTEKFANGDTQQVLFTDNKKFADGTAKSLCDTNMPQSSTLGFPLEFDHVGFVFELERARTRPDFNIIYGCSVFEWIYGQVTRWLQIRLTRIPEGITPSGSVSIDGNAGPAEASIIGNGWGVVSNFYNFTTPDRKARRITSTESFKNPILFFPALANLAATRKGTTFMLGILYGQL
jgi:hypothetical protein